MSERSLIEYYGNRTKIQCYVHKIKAMYAFASDDLPRFPEEILVAQVISQ